MSTNSQMSNSEMSNVNSQMSNENVPVHIYKTSNDIYPEMQSHEWEPTQKRVTNNCKTTQKWVELDANTILDTYEYSPRPNWVDCLPRNRNRHTARHGHLTNGGVTHDQR